MSEKTEADLVRGFELGLDALERAASEGLSERDGIAGLLVAAMGKVYAMAATEGAADELIGWARKLAEVRDCLRVVGGNTDPITLRRPAHTVIPAQRESRRSRSQ